MENIDGQETEIEEAGIEAGAPAEESTETGEVTPEETPEVEEPAEGEEQPPEKEDGVQKKINKIHREKKEAQELAEAERVKREGLEAKLKELQKEELPDIPPIPDVLDGDFDEKMEQRDEIIAKHAQERSRKEALDQIELDKVNAANKAHQNKVAGYVKAYEGRIEELGLDKESVSKSEEVVAGYIKNQAGLAEYLLSDAENGPLNIQYLSQNLEELEKVSNMPTTHAAVYIATKIAPEAQKLKPKQTQAPAPPYDPGSSKRAVDDDPMLAGASFE